MIQWTLIQRQLKQWYGDAIRLPVRWKNEPDTFKGKPHGTLRINSVRTLGNDQKRAKFDDTAAAGSELTYELVGDRLFSVDLRVHSRSQLPEEHALVFMERARTLLRAPWAYDLFRAAGISINEVLASLHLDHDFQDRVESEAVMEISFGTTSCEDDVRSKDSIIQATELTSNKLLDCRGAPIDDALQLNAVLIDARIADPDVTPEIEVFAGDDQVEAGGDQVFV